jgi:hypothetical protein
MAGGSTTGLASLLRRRGDGQVLALGVIIIILFILAAAVLIDVFHIEEARNWGYRTAQQAALAGASSGRNWEAFQPTLDPIAPTATPNPDPNACVNPGIIQLDASGALTAADDMLDREMKARGINTRSPGPSVLAGTYYADIRVLPDPGGGSIAGYPPNHVRLGASRGSWSTENPAVGVYLSFPVYTFFMSFVGKDYVTVSVFAAAEAAQPALCP